MIDKTAEQKSRQWHQTILIVIVFFSTTCLQWKIMMVSHRMSWCSRKKIFIFFTILCNNMGTNIYEIPLLHFEVFQKRKHMCIFWIQAKLGIFNITPFFLKEWQVIVIQTWIFGRHFLKLTKKRIQGNCYFKEKNCEIYCQR